MSMLALSHKTQRSIEREKLWIAREFFGEKGVIKASDHGFRTGSKDDYYFDFDYLLNDSYRGAIVLDIFARLINEINKEFPIDFLAFLDKASGGTVGAIRLSVALSIKTTIPNLTVRPGKGIIWERVKAIDPEHGLKGLRAVIVSDHCTSGREILHTALALRENNAKVNHAVVYTVRLDKLEADKFQAESIDLRYAFNLPQKLEELEAIAINY